MITMGGIGNNAGTLVGVIVGVGSRKTSSTFNLFYGGVIASSGMAGLFITFEEMALSVILLAFLIYKPYGLISEKRLHIPSIDYRKYLCARSYILTSQPTIFSIGPKGRQYQPG